MPWAGKLLWSRDSRAARAAALERDFGPTVADALGRCQIERRSAKKSAGAYLAGGRTAATFAGCAAPRSLSNDKSRVTTPSFATKLISPRKWAMRFKAPTRVSFCES